MGGTCCGASSTAMTKALLRRQRRSRLPVALLCPGNSWLVTARPAPWPMPFSLIALTRLKSQDQACPSSDQRLTAHVAAADEAEEAEEAFLPASLRSSLVHRFVHRYFFDRDLD